MKKFNSFEELKQAVRDGKTVNYKSVLYYVKIDFEGDFVIKCTDTPMQELLTGEHDLNDFFAVDTKK